MIITDPELREWQRLEKAWAQPCLPQTAFDLQAEIESARLRYFPAVSASPSYCFVNYGALVCICHKEGEGAGVISVHELLNHPETPLEVATLICKHELLHIEIPPREVDGKLKMHPPEFWEREKEICPERVLAWAWIWENFWGCLRRNKRKECITVLKDWKKRWEWPRIPLSGLTGWYRRDDEMTL